MARISGDIEIDLTEMLKEYEEELTEEARKAVEQVAKETAQRLRETSPKDSGTYAKGWTVKKSTRGINAVVYNAKKPGLTHLLEHQHPVRNQYGTWGVYPGKPHIAPAEEWANSEVIKRIEEALK